MVAVDSPDGPATAGAVLRFDGSASSLQPRQGPNNKHQIANKDQTEKQQFSNWEAKKTPTRGKIRDAASKMGTDSGVPACRGAGVRTQFSRGKILELLNLPPFSRPEGGFRGSGMGGFHCPGADCSEGSPADICVASAGNKRLCRMRPFGVNPCDHHHGVGRATVEKKYTIYFRLRHFFDLTNLESAVQCSCSK